MKPPTVIIIALCAAVTGGLISYVTIPNYDPEIKALLAGQVKLAEDEAAARAQPVKRRQDFFTSNPNDFPTSGGQQMAPRFDTK